MCAIGSGLNPGQMDNNADGALDRTLHAQLAELTKGISPAALMQAWSDWAIHLAAQPALSAQLLIVRPLMRATEAALQPVPSDGPRGIAALAGGSFRASSQATPHGPCAAGLPADLRRAGHLRPGAMSAPCRSLDPAQCLDPVRYLQCRHSHPTRERTLMKSDIQPTTDVNKLRLEA